MVFTDDCGDDTTQAEFRSGFNGRIFWIGGFQNDRLPFPGEILHCPFAIHFGDDDIAILRFSPFLDDDQVPFPDAFPGHGIPGDFQKEGGFRSCNQIFIHGHDISQFFFLGRWKAGLYRPNHGNAKGVLCKGQMSLLIFFKDAGLNEFIDPEMDDAL